jgi:hypothetical protein
MEICEFYVDDVTNRPMANILYSKTLDGRVTLRNPTKKLIDYLAIGNIYFDTDDIFGLGDAESKEDLSNLRDGSADNLALKKTSSEALDKALNEDSEDSSSGEKAGSAPVTAAKPTVTAPASAAQPVAKPTAVQPVAKPTATQPVATTPGGTTATSAVANAAKPVQPVAKTTTQSTVSVNTEKAVPVPAASPQSVAKTTAPSVSTVSTPTTQSIKPVVSSSVEVL